MTKGTIVIVMDNNHHIIDTNVYRKSEEWDAVIDKLMAPLRGHIVSVTYFWGGETQRYSEAEAFEVFCGK